MKLKYLLLPEIKISGKYIGRRYRDSLFYLMVIALLQVAFATIDLWSVGVSTPCGLMIGRFNPMRCNVWVLILRKKLKKSSINIPFFCLKFNNFFA